MPERRAVLRVPLTVPATIYDGDTEIHCETRDISPRGVAITGVPEGLPARALCLRLSESERTPSVLCDCFPVGKHGDRSNTWGLEFLLAPGEVPPGFHKLFSDAKKVSSDETLPRSAPQASQHLSDGSPESDDSDRTDFEKQLQDLYTEALDSLD